MQEGPFKEDTMVARCFVLKAQKQASEIIQGISQGGGGGGGPRPQPQQQQGGQGGQPSQRIQQQLAMDGAMQQSEQDMQAEEQRMLQLAIEASRGPSNAENEEDRQLRLAIEASQLEQSGSPSSQQPQQSSRRQPSQAAESEEDRQLRLAIEASQLEQSCTPSSQRPQQTSRQQLPSSVPESLVDVLYPHASRQQPSQAAESEEDRQLRLAIEASQQMYTEEQRRSTPQPGSAQRTQKRIDARTSANPPATRGAGYGSEYEHPSPQAGNIGAQEEEDRQLRLAMQVSQEQAELEQAIRASTEEGTRDPPPQTTPASTPQALQPNKADVASEPSQTNAAIYNALWAAATPSDFLGAGDAVAFFRASGLDNDALGDIWGQADAAARGSLTKDEFFFALKLIAERQAGTGPPKGYPQLAGHTEAALDTLVRERARAAQAQADAEAEANGPGLDLASDETVMYQALWQKAGKGSPADRMGPMEAVDFFQASGLNNEQLGAIWELADCKDPKGSLSTEEFFVALKLIALHQSGMDAAMDKIHLPSPPPNLDFGDVAPPLTATQPPVHPTNPTAVPTTLTSATPTSATPSTTTLKSAAAFIMNLTGADVSASQAASGADLREYLFLSGLPQDQLAVIWGMSDTNVTGSLDVDQVEVLLGLMTLAQQQAELDVSQINTTTPPPTLRGFDFPADTQEQPAVAVPTCETQARQILATAGLQPTDAIHGAKLRETLMQSGLPQDLLADIWGKADTSGIGQLNLEQLQKLLGMLYQAQNGQPADASAVSLTTPAPCLEGV